MSIKMKVGDEYEHNLFIWDDGAPIKLAKFAEDIQTLYFEKQGKFAFVLQWQNAQYEDEKGNWQSAKIHEDFKLSVAGAKIAASFSTGKGDDVLIGSDRADFLSGGEGKNKLVGGGGGDWLEIGRGENEAKGGAGRDTFDVLGGTSILSGGTGDDVFNFYNKGSAVIKDFELGRDHISFMQQIDSFDELEITSHKGGTLITAKNDDDPFQNTDIEIFLKDIDPRDLDSNDFYFT